MDEDTSVMDEPVSGSDKELIERAKAGSPEAWTKIYATHYRAIFRYVRARVFEQDIAEDLASATFVGAIKSIDSFKYRGRPLLAWLYRIARNVVATHQREVLRAQGRDFGLPRRVIQRLMRRGPARTPATDVDPISPLPGGGDPSAVVDRLDLHSALVELPENQREVVVLRFFVGLSALEVAEVMGKRVVAVYSLQARALLSLRERLR
ncbi:MAG: sigma-70 family RNA polymerase sigma factor [Chloroflexi bacterium]|nr:sigma-70 family RNA polymerase sigma factor [Chloroflexota bacterium]